MFVAVEKVAKMKGICNALGRESKNIFEACGKSQRSLLEERRSFSNVKFNKELYKLLKANPCVVIYYD